MKRVLLNTFLILALVLAFTSTVFAQGDGPDRFEGREVPESVAGLKLDTPVELSDVSGATLDRSLVGAEGDSKIIIRLSADSGAEAFAKGENEAAAKRAAKKQQDAFLKRVRKVDSSARLIGQVQMVMNAVFVEVDAAALPQLAQDPAVVRIAPAANYEMDLSETVPYIGASAVQDLGFDGSGIKVAVLDSGIDYTHAALGGSGDPADYAANDPNIIEPGTFPTAKVVGGYDFVGSDWPTFGPEAPDPDPLDDGPGAGHGTHVGHIIGGEGGVAPGVDLYAVKVCSSITTGCSGIALIQGMEFAVDPNGDGKVKDRLDIINMSLGSDYGQPFDDDLSLAVENATAVGVLTVSSAGNGSDKPYVVGTPSSTASALAVAQTNVPSAILPLMEATAPAGIAGLYQAVYQPWSAPLTAPIEAPLQYADGAGGNLNGCAAFTPGSLTGLIVLVDRGVCNFTLKIKNVGDAGGLIGIIGLVAPGDPFSGGDGGDPVTIPGYMISQADSNTLKSGLPATVVRFDPAVGIPLIGAMVGSSSRGPQNESNSLIKPEIGAPGASISAIAGTGTGEGPFGGTSGASPMVAGSAALLLEGFGGTKTSGKGTPSGNALGHGLSPVEVKALLMNNGDTNIINDAALGDLAAITRIGGGEVRVDDALAAPAAAWDADVPQGALSFGFVDVTDVVTLTKTVQVRNYSNEWRTYDITPEFRFEDDELNGAVSVSAPSSVTLNPGRGSDTYFDVTLTIDGALLRGNYMNSGSMGAEPGVLTLNEYDGYLEFDDGEHSMHMAWHVLPRQAADVVPDTTALAGGGFPEVIGLNNTGAGMAQNDAYALVATSPNIPEGDLGAQSPTPDIRGVGINTFPVPAGYCSGQESFIWAFAVNTWERQEHLMPVHHYVYLDTDQDGTDDYVVFNSDFSGFGTLSDGRHLTFAQDLVTGGASAFFFTEHSMNTGNTVLLICAEQVGLTGTDMLATNVDMDVYAQDWYYGGPGDWVTDLTVTPLGEQYYAEPNDVPGYTYDAAGLPVYDFGPFPGNTPEEGLLLVTNGDRGAGARGGATQDTEALLFIAE